MSDQPGAPAVTDTDIQDPPKGFFATIRQLGPGLIIAGSIVGSGELIATTKTGAQAGISLLWLIVIGCVIKVFVQIELGRYAITHGKTTLAGLNSLPGPRLRVNWIMWFWLVMMACAIGQLGGIVGGVGQAMAISFPLTGDYRTAIEMPSQSEIEQFLIWDDDFAAGGVQFDAVDDPLQRDRIRRGHASLRQRLDRLGTRGEEAVAAVRSGESMIDPVTWDDRYWAAVAALLTVALLYNGRYGLIQNFATTLVVAFTALTIANVVALQSAEQWRIPTAELLSGFAFKLPPGKAAIATALATFGIIGVGATELIAYPYWCIEKGYARYTGPRSDEPNWARRARGWIRVMHYDAFISMVVYTIATLAFYFTGVAVLYREGRDPEGMRMVSTLAAAYVPIFDEYAALLFLIGAVAVLYSTFLVALAGQTRIYTDALKIWRLIDADDPQTHRRSISFFGVVLPLVCVTLYWSGIDPVGAVLLSGIMQAFMLPLIGCGALYFLYTASDRRLRPRSYWDGLLIVSVTGLLIAGAWGAYVNWGKLAAFVGG